MEETAEVTIAFYISSPTWGGGEQYVYDLASALKTSGKITPVFLFPKSSDQEMIRRFREIGECPTFPFAGKMYRFSGLASYRLAKLLEHYEADILHINSRFAYFQAAMAKLMCKHRIRLIAVQHLVRQAKDNKLWRWAYGQIDTLVCVSQLVRRNYIPDGLEDAFKQIEVVHNSVKIEKRTCNNPDYSIARIIYHGRICEEKGVIVLLRALEKIQDLPWELHMAGAVESKYKEQWERALEESPVKSRVKILGFRSDIREELSHYSIGVIPSVVQEAFSLSALEDMSCGLAIASSDNGAVSEFVNDGENGLLVKSNDADALSKTLHQLISNSQLRKRLGYQAQKDFWERYNYDIFLDRMNRIYGI
ncbi:MAG: glycosyltransferase family 4 protein [Paludibacteraceae bacterium]|nr:glycosyltransferase family 4 protein [Paludibacteraceae bacterium]